MSRNSQHGTQKLSTWYATIKYHTEGSACRIENVRLDRLKTGLNLDKIEDDIEEDREGRLKD